jgi:hypothetical protein
MLLIIPSKRIYTKQIIKEKAIVLQMNNDFCWFLPTTTWAKNDEFFVLYFGKI